MSADYRLARRTLAGVDMGWNVYAGDTLIGWVSKHGNHWQAFVKRAAGGRGRRVGWDFFTTRRDAVGEVLIEREV